MRYDCQWLNNPPHAKQQTVKFLHVTTRSSMMDNTQTIKQDVKGPKINDVKLFIKDENRTNLYRKCKTNWNEHKNDNRWTTGSWLRQAHKARGEVKQVCERSIPT